MERALLFFYMGMMVMFGTSNTILLKFMDMSEVDGEKFEHPYVQVSLMAPGFLLCYLLYFVIGRKVSTVNEEPLLVQDMP